MIRAFRRRRYMDKTRGTSVFDGGTVGKPQLEDSKDASSVALWGPTVWRGKINAS